MNTKRVSLCATLAVLFVALSFSVAHGQYVTRDEFNALRGQVNNLSDQVAQLVSLQRDTLYALRGARPTTPVRYASQSGPPIRYVSDEAMDAPRDRVRSNVDRTETTVVVKIRIRMSDSSTRPSIYGSAADDPSYDVPANEAGWRGNGAVPIRAASYQQPLPTAPYGHWASPSGYRYGT